MSLLGVSKVLLLNVKKSNNYLLIKHTEGTEFVLPSSFSLPLPPPPLHIINCWLIL